MSREQMPEEEWRERNDRALEWDNKTHRESVRDTVTAAMDEHRPIPGQPDRDLVRTVAGAKEYQRKLNEDGPAIHQPFHNPRSEPAKLHQSLKVSYAAAEANIDGRYSDANQDGMFRGQEGMRSLMTKIEPQHRALAADVLNNLRDVLMTEAMGGRKTTIPPEVKAWARVDPQTGHWDPEGAMRVQLWLYQNRYLSPQKGVRQHPQRPVKGLTGRTVQRPAQKRPLAETIREALRERGYR